MQYCKKKTITCKCTVPVHTSNNTTDYYLFYRKTHSIDNNHNNNNIGYVINTRIYDETPFFFAFSTYPRAQSYYKI